MPFISVFKPVVLQQTWDSV